MFDGMIAQIVKLEGKLSSTKEDEESDVFIFPSIRFPFKPISNPFQCKKIFHCCLEHLFSIARSISTDCARNVLASSTSAKQQIPQQPTSNCIYRDRLHCPRSSNRSSTTRSPTPTPRGIFPSMTDAKRSRRSTASRNNVLHFHRLPELMEEIEVLWDLQGKLVWWKADVVVINLVDNTDTDDGNKATLRYRALRNYEAVEYDVVFLPTPSTAPAVKRLQHCSPQSTELTPWKFPEEKIDEGSYARNRSALIGTEQSTRDGMGSCEENPTSFPSTSGSNTALTPKKRPSPATKETTQEISDENSQSRPVQRQGSILPIASSGRGGLGNHQPRDIRDSMERVQDTMHSYVFVALFQSSLLTHHKPLRLLTHYYILAM